MRSSSSTGLTFDVVDDLTLVKGRHWGLKDILSPTCKRIMKTNQTTISTGIPITGK